jgi:hypothetical protein
MKRCTLCNLEKEETEFYPKVPWCKSCKARYARHYHAEQKAAGPYGLMILRQFVQKIYRGQIVTVDDPKQARPYATYYNANLTRRRLEKQGFDVKIVPLKS